MTAHQSNLAKLAGLINALPCWRVPCKSCSKDHEPIDRFYLGRERWVCSQNCWDDWMNFGRWGQ
jgi:hypothetical protein